MFDTLNKMIRQLETLTNNSVSLNSALDLLEEASGTYDELIVINVIRESFNELVAEERLWKTA